jgi:hypothetical protein
MLDPTIVTFRCYLDTRRAVVTCPECGTERAFRGSALFVARPFDADESVAGAAMERALSTEPLPDTLPDRPPSDRVAAAGHVEGQ